MTYLVPDNKTGFANMSLLWEKSTLWNPQPNNTKKGKREVLKRNEHKVFGFANTWLIGLALMIFFPFCLFMEVIVIFLICCFIN